MEVTGRDPAGAGTDIGADIGADATAEATAEATVAPSLRRRRRQVEERLAAAGLLRGPRRLGAAGDPPEDRVELATRLAGCLADLGPTFTAFGRYLSTRADLLGLPAADAMAAELGVLQDTRPEPATAEAVETLLESDLGAPAGDLFRRFAAHPVEVTGFVQASFVQMHDAQLPDGTPVRVYLPVSGTEEARAADLPALSALARVWPDPDFDFATLTAAFHRHLEASEDARAQAAYLADAAAEAAGDRLLWLPRLVASHSGRRVLTLERTAGDPPGARPGRAAEAAKRARDLVLAWLEQALTGDSFAVDPRLRFLADGRPAFCGGEVARCRPRVRRELAAYLEAVASDEPETASRHLRRALGDPPEPSGDLARHLRQRVTFQEGMASDGLHERLMLHWGAVRSCGVPLHPEVDDFHRGLLLCLRRARRLDPGGDPLRDALEERRWRRAWNEMVSLAEPERLAQVMESYLSAASVLPQGLERALDRLGADVGRPGAPQGQAARSARQGASGPGAGDPATGGPAGALALLLALAAVAVVTVGLAPTFPWAEPVGGVAFLLVAFHLLRPRGGRP